jgi:general secretion pathway protein C
VAGATIQGIGRDRVILSNGGRTEFLAFPDPTLTPDQRAAQAQGKPPAIAVAPPPAQAMAPRPAPPLQPSSAPPALQPSAGPPSPASALQRLDASPTQGGYRIGANGPPGFQPGDVVTSVNGTPMSDPTAAQAALTAAQSSGLATLQVLRDGKRMTLTVPLR